MVFMADLLTLSSLGFTYILQLILLFCLLLPPFSLLSDVFLFPSHLP